VSPMPWWGGVLIAHMITCRWFFITRRGDEPRSHRVR
jgi:hypothetical protein